VSFFNRRRIRDCPRGAIGNLPTARAPRFTAVLFLPRAPGARMLCAHWPMASGEHPQFSRGRGGGQRPAAPAVPAAGQS